MVKQGNWKAAYCICGTRRWTGCSCRPEPKPIPDLEKKISAEILAARRKL